MRAVRFVVLLLLVAASASAAKPPLHGLLSMGAYKFVVRSEDQVNSLEALNAKPGIFGGIVILASWREMQAGPNAGITENNAIDKGLELVREYNRRNPQKPLGVKLRIWGGFVAPDWAKQIGGPIIHVVHKKPRTIGRFWSPEYRKAWRHFQEMLAAKYDNDPLVREVAMTSCMSFTAEPMFLPGEPAVAEPLTAAGFKPFQFKKCLMEGLDDYAAWQETNIETPLNPIHMPLGNPKGDHAFTEQYMKKCRKMYGSRCIFDNHDLDTTPAKAVLPVYDAMKKMGGPIEFRRARRLRRTSKEPSATASALAQARSSSIRISPASRWFRMRR